MEGLYSCLRTVHKSLKTAKPLSIIECARLQDVFKPRFSSSDLVSEAKPLVFTSDNCGTKQGALDVLKKLNRVLAEDTETQYFTLCVDQKIYDFIKDIVDSDDRYKRVILQLGPWHSYCSVMSLLCAKLHDGGLQQFAQNMGLSKKELKDLASGLARGNNTQFRVLATMWTAIGCVLVDELGERCKQPDVIKQATEDIQKVMDDLLSPSTDEQVRAAAKKTYDGKMQRRQGKTKPDRLKLSIEVAREVLTDRLRGLDLQVPSVKSTEASTFFQLCASLGEAHPSLRPLIDFFVHDGPSVIFLFLGLRHNHADLFHAGIRGAYPNYTATNNINYLSSLWSAMTYRLRLHPALRDLHDVLLFRSIKGRDFHSLGADEHQEQTGILCLKSEMEKVMHVQNNRYVRWAFAAHELAAIRKAFHYDMGLQRTRTKRDSTHEEAKVNVLRKLLRPACAFASTLPLRDPPADDTVQNIADPSRTLAAQQQDDLVHWREIAWLRLLETYLKYTDGQRIGVRGWLRQYMVWERLVLCNFSATGKKKATSKKLNKERMDAFILRERLTQKDEDFKQQLAPFPLAYYDANGQWRTHSKSKALQALLDRVKDPQQRKQMFWRGPFPRADVLFVDLTGMIRLKLDGMTQFQHVAAELLRRLRQRVEQAGASSIWMFGDTRSVSPFKAFCHGGSRQRQLSSHTEAAEPDFDDCTPISRLHSIVDNGDTIARYGFFTYLARYFRQHWWEDPKQDPDLLLAFDLGRDRAVYQKTADGTSKKVGTVDHVAEEGELMCTLHYAAGHHLAAYKLRGVRGRLRLQPTVAIVSNDIDVVDFSLLSVEQNRIAARDHGRLLVVREPRQRQEVPVVSIHDLAGWLRTTPLSAVGNGVFGMVAALRYLGGDYVPHTDGCGFATLMGTIMDSEWVADVKKLGVRTGTLNEKKTAWIPDLNFYKLLQVTLQLNVAKSAGVGKVRNKGLWQAALVFLKANECLQVDQHLYGDVSSKDVVTAEQLVHRLCDFVVEASMCKRGTEARAIPFWDNGLHEFAQICAVDVIGGQLGDFLVPDMPQEFVSVYSRVRKNDPWAEVNVQVGARKDLSLTPLGVKWIKHKGHVRMQVLVPSAHSEEKKVREQGGDNDDVADEDDEQEVEEDDAGVVDDDDDAADGDGAGGGLDEAKQWPVDEILDKQWMYAEDLYGDAMPGFYLYVSWKGRYQGEYEDSWIPYEKALEDMPDEVRKFEDKREASGD